MFIELPIPDGGTVLVNTDQVCYVMDADDFPKALDGQLKSVLIFAPDVFVATTLRLGQVYSTLAR